MINIDQYIDAVLETNRLPKDDIYPYLFGLFGEIGGVLSVSKKRHRENEAYTGFNLDLMEEAGDALWYFVSICDRAQLDSREMIRFASDTNFEGTDSLDKLLLDLSATTMEFIQVASKNEDLKISGQDFIKRLLAVLNSKSISLRQVINFNYLKIVGRFREPEIEELENFDAKFDSDEQLPTEFEIEIVEKKEGKTYLKWRGVFIGDPLTDSIRDKDGFRFHDVFHFANAAILHWSPTFRSLIKHKRKSCANTEEAEDSGRAIVVEEGLTAWLFSYANTPEIKLFEGHDTVSFDVLKTIQQFTKGFEVSRCPLFLWEKAILEGYKVFRQLKQNRGGIIIGNRNSRTIKFKPLSER